MPTINIYLPEDLFEYVKKQKSKIVQEALRQHKKKITDQHQQPAAPTRE